MRVLAVDPGTVGALCVLDGTDVLLLDDLPTHQISVGRKATRAELDRHTLPSMIAAHSPFDHAFVERVNSRPGEGVTSAFRFGIGYGAVLGVLAAMAVPLTLVQPKDWQSCFHKCGPSPDAARQRACMLYPQIAPSLARRRDQHRADALLLASYGLHRLIPAEVTT